MDIHIGDNHDRVADDLDKWKAEYDNDYQRNILYQFSPEWDLLHRSYVQRYDELKKIQEQSSLARLSWQDGIEENWRALEEDRKTSFSPMKDHLRSISPLSAYMERRLSQCSQDREYSWRTTLRNFDMLVGLCLNRPSSDGNEEGSDFIASLSSSQKGSFLVLTEWMHFLYCDSKLPEAARAFMEKRIDRVSTRWPIDKEYLVSRSESILNSTSLYHSYCFYLFLLEFHPQTWEYYMSYECLHQLQTIRYRATCQAIAQRVAYAALYPRRSQKFQNIPYPRPIAYNAHWDYTPESGRGRPYYLWNNMSKQTVPTSLFPSCPPYVCISHTWGRWRKPSAANVAGVPWLVPENSRYDVSNLPELLGQLDFDFIWFDLFCIPQDGSPQANIEIANQASIFHGASRCIAWLNDVDSWSLVRRSMEWMSLRHLQNTNDPPPSMIDKRLKRIFRSLSGHSRVEIMKSKPVAENLVTEESGREWGPDQPASWFSSLWTLQESILCPDVELYSKTWQPLCDKSGAYIGLRTLMEFIQKTASTMRLVEKIAVPICLPMDYELAMLSTVVRELDSGTRRAIVPRTVFSLELLNDMTRLSSVLNTLSPAGIFTNANLRQCSESRAPAIMSALGVTKWYKQRLGDQKPQEKERLVLKSYPLAFLQECALKFGAKFFEVLSVDKSRTEISFFHLLRVSFQRKSIGSMLPFSGRHGWDNHLGSVFDNCHVDISDHEAVKHWEVRHDGSVRIRTAGIFTMSRNPVIEDVHGFIFWNGGQESYESSALWGTLADLSGTRHVYAVALYQDGPLIHGILLQAVKIPVLGKTYLVKTGSFGVSRVGLPPSQAVNWTVL